MPDQRIEVGDLNACLTNLGLEGTVLVVGSRRSAALVDESALDISVTRYEGSRSHNPAEAVGEAIAVSEQIRPAAIIGVGSASAIDLAKAVNEQLRVRLVAIPTTLGGAEMTRFYGSRAADGTKGGGSGRQLLPGTVVYDPTQLASLTTEWLAASGMNALAHCVEAHYARTKHWFGTIAATQAGCHLPGLLRAAAQERDRKLHEDLLRCACLAGFATNTNGMGLHHAICHVLGGLTGVPHARLNAAVLPAAIATNLALAPDRVGPTLDALGIDHPASSITEVGAACGLDLSLQGLGVTTAQLDDAVAPIMRAHHLRNNPAPIADGDIRACLQLAYTGGE